MKDRIKIGIIGATGAVGRELLSILEVRQFPVSETVLFASPRSQGKTILWKGQEHLCRVLERGCFEGLQMVFFDASDAVSKEWVPQAAEEGAWVIDNSGAFRLEKDILLLVPEVNGKLLDHHLQSKPLSQFSARERILSGPNCSTVQLVMALKPIREGWGIRRVGVSTYQSVSGAGTAAMNELLLQTEEVLENRPTHPKVFTHPIAFNCIPHIGGFKEDGYTSEEHKIMSETRKLLDMPQLKISATAVRVPTLSCHGESIHVECERPFQLEEVRAALRAQPGIIVQDNPTKNIYPLGKASPFNSTGDEMESATGRDAVYVGRVRKDPSVEHGLNLWVVSDNLRKGAALNAIQVGEILLKLFQ